MVKIDATQYDHRGLNQEIRQAADDCEITGALGQRFIAAGLDQKNITITGTPGNALGAYLNGAKITVYGNAQDAVGDTMNEGEIVIHGNIGDAAGYAMRGGRLFVKGDAGYRAGIHMKEYREKCPVMVIGGKCGSFLGEYQAGGVILVLGLTQDAREIVSNFPCTGMHGGKMFLRSDCKHIHFPQNVTASPAGDEDLDLIQKLVHAFCARFGCDEKAVLDAPFTKIVPDSKNPYQQMYVAN
jgi:glutamate synthase domain-containing protein 3